jgi:hypothetical protein
MGARTARLSQNFMAERMVLHGSRGSFVFVAPPRGVARHVHTGRGVKSPTRDQLSCVALGMLFAFAGANCRRPLPADEGRDAGQAPVGPAPADGAPADAGPSSLGDAKSDAPDDAVAGGMCPTGVEPLDVCGCGCCGPVGTRICYYPALGESRDTIPNPIPPPSTCIAAGCSFGVRHLCCADPGQQPSSAGYCAADVSLEDFPRFNVLRRDGAVCTTLDLAALVSSPFPIAAPPGFVVSDGTTGPCDGSVSPVHAIGGLGSVSPGHIKHGDTSARYDVHVVLFFDSGGATADSVRLDVEDLPISAGACFPCVPGETTWDGCNTCSCAAGGVMICNQSQRACARDGGFPTD